MPHHRANRGMGGSKARDVPANIIVVCQLNGLMESDAKTARLAIEYGWKLKTSDDPLKKAVYDAYLGVWWMLDNEYGKRAMPWPREPFYRTHG